MQSVINYDPPSQQVPNVRTVYKIPRGVAVLPSTIKLLNITINPTDSSGTPIESYFPALSGIWASISQIELKVNDKPVDLFLSKQASTFKNSLGSPDLQKDINSQLTGSSNNIFQDLGNNNEYLDYKPVDSTPQCVEFNKVLDYLNNRLVIDEGLSITITWDSQNFNNWLIPNTATPVSNIAINPGYLSYESVLDHNIPQQEFVNFKQTIEEAIIIPAISSDNTVQQWEQRMNSLRDKTISRTLFVCQPLGNNLDIQNTQYTYGTYCSIGQFNEYLNIVIDGTQRLTFKGFSNNAHKLAMTNDTFGVSSSSQSSWYLPKNTNTLLDSNGAALNNYFSYLGVDLESFVDKECVIQYNRTSGTLKTNPSTGAQLKLYMISEVWKQHNTKTGVCTYVKV